MTDMRHGTCPLCGHNEIIEAKPRPGGIGGPLALTDNLPRAIGHLWSYSCRRCDYTQLFAQNTAQVPISEAIETRLVVGPTPEPFR